MKLPKIPKIKLSHISYRSYVRYLRRQSLHVQHVHAFIFALLLSSLVAAYILYYDYGFWHDVYVQKTEVADSLPETNSLIDQSPTQTLSHFFEEAKQRFSTIGSGSMNLLESKDVYTNTASTTP